MATIFLSIRPSSSSSSSFVATHRRASAPSLKRLVSWPSFRYNSSQPIRLRRRQNTAPTPASFALAHTFKPFGTVSSIDISRNQETGISRGSENVTMGSIEEAKSTIVGLDDESAFCCNVTTQIQPIKPPIQGNFQYLNTMVAGMLVLGGIVGSASAGELPILGSLQLSEPSNALSLPTWAIHISSVVEWITAMALVWQYGEKSGYESWKGLSWGMVPLLGGAFCACTWHFFYNSESLEVLVALQAALTVIGNATMCYAAFRICKASEERSKNNL